MNRHKNARTTPYGRALMVRRVRELGWSAARAAEAAGVERAHGAQMARPSPLRGCSRAARSLVAAAPLAAVDGRGLADPDRALAPVSNDRR